MRRVIISVLLLASSLACTAQNLDTRLLATINSAPKSLSDKHWHTVSNSVAHVGLASPILLFSAGLISGDSKMETNAAQLMASVLVASKTSTALKQVFKRARPFKASPEIIYDKGGATSYSFPSGHTSEAFATATSITLSYPKWYVAIPAFSYAGAVGYSRMYLGVHYPSDVIGGAVVGSASAYATYKLNKWLHSRKISPSFAAGEKD